MENIKEKNSNKIIITISKESENDELFDILMNAEKAPFQLPRHIMFPSGKKDFARRARMLMLAGIDFLKEKYPEEVKIETSENSSKSTKTRDSEKETYANF